MSSTVRFPLTPALSPSEGERENCRPPFCAMTFSIAPGEAAAAAGTNHAPTGGPIVPPLPLRGGEGRGEGASRARRPFPSTRPIVTALCLLAVSILSAVAAAAESRQAPALT